MSQTVAIGVYRASHWTAAAAKLVEYLDSLLGTFKDSKKVEVPVRVIVSLQGLLSSALLAAKDELMPNPQASINDFLIVREVMRGCGIQKLEREDVRVRIEEYLSLLNRLTEPHEMSDLSRGLVVRVEIFFMVLRRQGDMDRYDHFMREAHPYNHR